MIKSLLDKSYISFDLSDDLLLKLCVRFVTSYNKAQDAAVCVLCVCFVYPKYREM